MDLKAWLKDRLVSDPRVVLTVAELTNAISAARGQKVRVAVAEMHPNTASVWRGEILREVNTTGLLPRMARITADGRRTNGWRGWKLVEPAQSPIEVTSAEGAAQENEGDPWEEKTPFDPPGAIEEVIDHADEAVRRALEKDARRFDAAENRALVRELVTLRKRIEVIDALAAEPVSIGQRPKLNSAKRSATACLLLSDLHVEEEVWPEQVNDTNRYNLQIADSSLRDVEVGFNWMLESARHGYEIKDAMIWLGGDTFTGHIHEDCVEVTALSPVQSVAWLFNRLVAMISRIAHDPLLERILIQCDIGNHGRTTKERRVATAIEHSYEWLLYYMIAQHFEGDPKVEVVVPTGAFSYTQVGPLMVRTTHGDKINFHGGIGGPMTPATKAVVKWDQVKHADLTFVGHFHKYMSTEWLVMNGSLIGASPYGIQYGFEEPRQAFCLIDSSRGKCLSTPIWVSRRMTT